MINWQWKTIDELESQYKYGLALYYAYATWQDEPKNIKVFLRLSFLVWNIVVERIKLVHDENIGDDVEDFIDFVPLLQELERYGKVHFHDHTEFLWMYGYMIYMFPFYFEDNDETVASELYQKAYDLQPDDPIVKMLYFEDKHWDKKTPEGQKRREAVSEILLERFQGNGEFQQYFIHVLNNK